ncbi:MAG: hypothetical protein KAW47_11265, partial [Thermoplasmatales archaeon]|nr:hypothetical protein [Thermoplasmatales archaeon]
MYKLVRIVFMLFLCIVFASCGTSNKKFEQIGYSKKELSSGSYNRVYSIYVKDFFDNLENWTQIENHAKSQMHTEGGS